MGVTRVRVYATKTSAREYLQSGTNKNIILVGKNISGY